MHKFEILNNIKMKDGQLAVVRLRMGIDHYQFGKWDGKVFDPMPSEFGEKMMVSRYFDTFQACIDGAEAYEAWVFTADGYEAAWLADITDIQDKPYVPKVQKVKPPPVSWWKTFFRTFA